MAWQQFFTTKISAKKIIFLLLINILLHGCNSILMNKGAENNSSSSTSASQSDTNNTDTAEAPSQLPNKQASESADQAINSASTSISTDTTSPQLDETEIEEAPANLWDRIREGFVFDDAIRQNPIGIKRINKHRQRIINSPRMVSTITTNATPYLYFVVNELAKNNIPMEIALLPIVESHYDPFAYSPGRASGLWQFIPSTGKRFGLTQDWWQDERRDTIASTGSAIQYLLYLHNRFDNDWLLALAAYNAGQGNVSKAIRKNKQNGKPTDFWSLKLPKETQHYVPKLLAWKDIIENPAKYNIDLQVIPDQPYFEIVNVKSQIDLAQAAELSGVDIDDIYQLNPAYNRWATDPSPPHDLLVPLGKGDTFQKNLKKIPSDKRITWQRYIIKKHDTLIKIAHRFDTSTDLIAKINGINGNRIHEGKALLIPSASKTSDYYSKSAEQRLSKRQSRSPSKNRQRVEHRVAAGENLWDIARAYNVSVSAISRWNNMSPKDILSVNRKLTIWQKSTTESQANNETRKLFYKVKQGDSLHYIANKFKVKVHDIKSWNKIETQKYIQPGQLLTLYVALTDRQLMFN
jgi:membrane-bound lytic murein transglycosylase D